ncbi:WecB/TagA/CpsF family glycosyltransferase [Deinococcus sp. 6GRE01]|uniref:WecB/TagA/CpsF family glycosyltransferase n=1 Tax=Deinococcus sp. 6GRE01 TaxID=2745873 RepID=UPI001E351FAE|nr:WecB/TagA/CpsF family glycosyltransferase [Deinococcus sp. 6GRE01]MCD0156958.1 WecB/TagA/CpsF family glycosyltransferase [Deinococcus sp. 6GRE01]
MRIINQYKISKDTYELSSERIIKFTNDHTARRVHAANVHMLMEGYDDPEFQNVIDTADLVVPDGVPLVWALRLLGYKKATRIYGPTLTLHICESCAYEGVPIGLYGGTPESLLEFKAFLHHEYPGIRIACAIAPPFRPLSQEEDDSYTQEILDSGARILFVGIGCPKQEWWMYNHRDRLPLVMLGVGAAFDFHSGRVKQSPAVLQRLGLEWLFRLVMEPKRLWKRYAKHNPRFVALFARQLLNERILGRKGVPQ